MKFIFGKRKAKKSLDWRVPYRLCDDPTFGVEEAPPAGLDTAETGEAAKLGCRDLQQVEATRSRTGTGSGFRARACDDSVEERR